MCSAAEALHEQNKVLYTHRTYTLTHLWVMNSSDIVETPPIIPVKVHVDTAEKPGLVVTRNWGVRDAVVYSRR